VRLGRFVERLPEARDRLIGDALQRAALELVDVEWRQSDDHLVSHADQHIAVGCPGLHGRRVSRGHELVESSNRKRRALDGAPAQDARPQDDDWAIEVRERGRLARRLDGNGQRGSRRRHRRLRGQDPTGECHAQRDDRQESG
jgi:hypothetical protein